MMVTRFPRLALHGVRTLSVAERHNLVTIQNMAQPGRDPVPAWDDPGLDPLIEAIVEARAHDRPVVWSMGAHVIKNGLSRYVIELVKRGWITHVAGNGATSIHDFELAYLGGTSEDVAKSIEDGTFGMWEETGRWMNEALIAAARDGLGYGAGLASYMRQHPARFPFGDDCVILQTEGAGRPYTCHVALGTDIIHQHPIADFGATALTSARDFARLCETVAGLDGGVYLNLGSAVAGPLIFLRALSLAYNRGFRVHPRAAAHFDLQPEHGVRRRDGQDVPPRARTELLDPVQQLGGQAWYFTVAHEVSIPNLYARLVKRGV